MRHLFLCCAFVFGTFIAKAGGPRFIEVRASVDIMGNIYMNPGPEPLRKNLKDTSADIKEIKTALRKTNNAIDAVNNLAEIHWVLVSVVNVNKNSDGNPNSSFIVYYFRKDE